jgi:hypothetical protein
MLAQVFNTTVDSIMELNPGIDPRNLQIGQVVTIAPGYQYYASYPDQPTNNEDGENNLMDLSCYISMLWYEHVAWTRMAVVALLNNLPETELVLQRLLRNATDFAEALTPFYGEEAAQEFAGLFSDHITIAAELVRAAQSGDTAAYEAIEQRWYDNADLIAEFLSGINPSWSQEDWSAMLDEHLALLSENIAAMIAQNFEESINGFDDIVMQAQEMAEMMAEGIEMQFPG